MTFDNNDGAPVRLPWLTMAATVLLAAGILVALRPALARRVEAYSTARPMAGPVLHATPVGDSVRIWWPAGLSASELSIKDGGEWRRIELDARARAAGEYLYRPASSEVLVRLNADTVLVMGLVPAPVPAPVEVAKVAPATPVPDEQTADRAIATAPEAVDRKVPQVLPRALLSVHGTIRVDVQVVVAADGSVQSAELATPVKSSYFNRLSLEAARGSVYPASPEGATMTLRYEYSRDGVQVSSPAQ